MDTQRYVGTIKKFANAYRASLWTKNPDWPNIDTVLLLCGHIGIGKSTIALSFCESNPLSCYFSFRNIESRMAPSFFSDGYPDRMRHCTNWQGFFEELKIWSARKSCVIFFDDVDDRNDKADFYIALSSFLNDNKNRRAFVVLITRSDAELPIAHRALTVEPLALHDISKRYPLLIREDMVRIYTLTGGIPALVSLYDFNKSYHENLRSFLQPNSIPCRYIEQLISDGFRSPECYNTLMYAMANGHHRISDIADFCGYASNKCDKYMKALSAAGLIQTNQKQDEAGRFRTHYNIKNSFLLLWFRYVFPTWSNFSRLLTGEETSAISTELDRTIVKEAYRSACLRQLEKLHSFGSIRIDHGSPERYNVNVDDYVFDFVQTDRDRILFVKIWDEIGAHVDKAAFTEMENAARTLKPFYDSYFILFSIHRFSDYCRECAGKYENVKLVQAEGLYL